MSNRDLSFLDDPNLIRFIFYPRKQTADLKDTENIFTLLFEVDNGPNSDSESNIQIGSRFYKAAQEPKFAPTILFFHGNGEIAADYDFIGPMYQKMRVNLVVVDYRGYGLSTGTPSFSTMLNDAHSIYQQFRTYLLEHDYFGPVSVMGRSLGSASALEIASAYQKQLASLIIESGFYDTYGLLERLGIPRHYLPEEKEKEASAHSAVSVIEIPSLIIHGENDMIIPYENGELLYENLSSQQKELLMIPNAGHNDLLLVGPQEYFSAIQNLVHRE